MRRTARAGSEGELVVVVFDFGEVLLVMQRSGARGSGLVLSCAAALDSIPTNGRSCLRLNCPLT